jgi:hypothetical protein
MNRRTLLSAAAAAVALLLAGYSAYWWMMAGRLEAGLDAWIASEKQAGVTIDSDRSGIGGYPFTFTTTFRHLHVTGTAGGRPIDWQGSDVDAWVWPFDIRALHVATAGDHRVALGVDTAEIHAGDLRLLLQLDAAGRVSSATVEGAATTIGLADNRSAAFQSLRLSFEKPPSPPQTDRDPLLHFAISATALQLPPDIPLLTTGPIDAVAAEGTVKGPMPGGPLKEALAGWRDQGGTIEITSFTGAQAPLSLSGSATVALDGGLQPVIAANLAAKGLGPAVDLLAQQKRMKPNDVLKVKLFIAATEQKAPDGGTQVTSGITIQNGYLYLGPFKVARVARIDWP